jgi:hypothetical protein
MFPDELDAELLGDGDVLDDAVGVPDEGLRAEAFPGVRFGSPRRGGAKVPLANLEPPSSARVELTPSPVPRVSLSPATGAVDISLVPGPNMAHSRNLPTLAAQHVLGRRQPRRRAPAVTLPPGDVTADPLGPAELAHEVRSSRREVVLGLTIGLGLSMLLALVGQAYLREDVVAETQPTPAELESITLSARPETDARGAAWPGAAASAPPATGTSAALQESAASGGELPGVAQPEARSAEPLGVASSNGADSPPAGTIAPPSSAFSDGERMLAHSAPEGVRGVAGGVLPRAARDSSGHSVARNSVTRSAVTRSAGPRSSMSRAHRTPAIAVEPPAFESEKTLSEAARDRSPMSPAESAGLGLDLPL